MPPANKNIIAALFDADEGPPPGLDALAETAEIRHATSADELKRALPGAEVLLVTDFRTGVLGEAWSSADGLRWIHATSAGVDAVLIPQVVDSDIPVTNARGIFDRGIAEYVLGAILLFAKDMHGSLRYKHQRQWCHRDTERIDDRRVLVVGAGAIGREIGALLKAAGMAVTGVSGRGRDADPVFGRVHPAGVLHDLLGAADFVVIATPLTSATEGLFDAATLACMPTHARLINVGRGPVVVTEDLVGALREGGIAGAALDVFEQEPLPSEHPLWEMDNVFITAHMAGDFIGWREALIKQFMDNFRRWQAGEPLFNVVDKRRGYGAAGG